jgi:NADH:flavin oxidoreductase / NADH oxidase family
LLLADLAFRFLSVASWRQPDGQNDLPSHPVEGEREMYEKLFSPVKIGRMEVKNRVAMTSMGVNLAAAGGGVNDDIVAFYEGRARGGIGPIVS